MSAPVGRKLALVVGMEYYGEGAGLPNLEGARVDAEEMERVLESHRDHTPNFDVTVLVSSEDRPVTSEMLLSSIDALLDGVTSSDDVVFYFSGHGVLSRFGLQLVTAEKGGPLDSGVFFDAIMHRVVREACATTIILDCCDSGVAGDSEIVHLGEVIVLTQLRSEMTILAAASRDEDAKTAPGQTSTYTTAVVGALTGLDGGYNGQEITALTVHKYALEQLADEG